MNKSFITYIIIFIFLLLIINLCISTKAKWKHSDDTINRIINKNLSSSSRVYYNDNTLNNYNTIAAIENKINKKEKIDNVQTYMILEELKRKQFSNLSGIGGRQGPPGPTGPGGQMGPPGPKGDNGVSEGYIILNDTWTVGCNETEEFSINLKKYKGFKDGLYWTANEPRYNLYDKSKVKSIKITALIYDFSLPLIEAPNCSGSYSLNILGSTETMFIDYEKNRSNVEAEISLDTDNGILKINTWPEKNKTYKVILEGKILF